MRTAVILYHKNIDHIYKPEWIEQCINSIMNQTLKEFCVIELNYGKENVCYWPHLPDGDAGEREMYIHKPMSNHIEAMNFLYDFCFKEMDFDVVFNVNMDDVFRPERFELQLKAIRDNAYQLVSSNFCYINEESAITKHLEVSKKNMKHEIQKGHNVIAHPCVAMHRSFWLSGLRYDVDKIGWEDLDLWQKALRFGMKMHILPEFLLHYRIHENQITKKMERGETV